MINNENSYASGKKLRPRGPRSSLTILRPQYDLEARALDYFFLYHVVHVDDLTEDIPDVAQGLCICITLWKASGRKSIMVDTALACVSLAVFAQIQKYQNVAVDASVRYGRLLRMMQKKVKNIQLLSTTSSDDEETVDAYLLTMLLMGRYESTMHNDINVAHAYEASAALQRWVHHEGALIILERWSEQDLKGCAGPSTTIMKFARRGMIQSSFRQNAPLQDWIINGRRFGECDFGLAYDRIVIDTITLYQQADSLLQCDRFMESALGLVQNAREIECALRRWTTGFPDEWAFRRRDLERPNTMLPTEYLPSTHLICDKQGYSAVWILYFATAMLVNSISLKVLDRLATCQNFTQTSCVDHQRLNCLQVLHALSENMTSAVAAFLSVEKVSSKDVDEQHTRSPPPVLSRMGLIVWPLALAASVYGIEPQHEKWLKMELSRIGKLLGNGFLELAAISPKWTILNNCNRMADPFEKLCAKVPA
ncbi:hypothetical protein LTR84_004130 [Exophiala bonariae]|uniref:Transcription factor domain-containing protein n=1 Tax=Exophiala bonariae TaxID=1690606 RepID=A0AAV9N890_9EURO|nr:hypothetical protein LTR84_004130 [Exophiala bonariae]